MCSPCQLPARLWEGGVVGPAPGEERRDKREERVQPSGGPYPLAGGRLNIYTWKSWILWPNPGYISWLHLEIIDSTIKSRFTSEIVDSTIKSWLHLEILDSTTKSRCTSGSHKLYDQILNESFVNARSWRMSSVSLPGPTLFVTPLKRNNHFKGIPNNHHKGILHN